MKKIINNFVCIILIFVAQGVFAKNLGARKQRFVKKMTALSEQVNQRILKSREQLEHLATIPVKKLSSEDEALLQKLASKYKVNGWNVDNKSDWDRLLRRVDIVPTSLVVAQSAIESAWGTSRFAKAGNNLFGQWCYKKGCGIVPLRRPAGRTYEVQKFRSTMDSINAYVHNLNTNPSYRSLREKRSVLRTTNQPITGYALASGLSRYSQLGEKYVGIVRGVINRYQLNHYTA